VILTFSDYLGDRRIVGVFSSLESFSNFDVIYADLGQRLQWQVHLFDNRSYFIAEDFIEGDVERGRAYYKQTGLIGSLLYPFSFYTRAELGGGYLLREFLAQSFEIDPETGEFVPTLVPIDDNFPLAQASLVGDSTRFTSWGPVSGRRWRLDSFYAPDLDESGTLFWNSDLDVRQYLQVTQRSNLALRGFFGYATGNQPTPYSFGGLDTLRGTDFREFSGDRVFFANVEYRFPLIDVVATPILVFQGVRGVIFFDVGGAWYNDFEDFDFYNSDEGRLEDAVAAYGWGFTMRLFGLDLNWDFAKRYDFKEAEDGFRTSFWIGTRF
jgi:outer membrane protein assembly factor BamA